MSMYLLHHYSLASNGMPIALNVDGGLENLEGIEKSTVDERTLDFSFTY